MSSELHGPCNAINGWYLEDVLGYGFFLSQQFEKFPWLEVDIGEEFIVTQVQVKSRMHEDEAVLVLIGKEPSTISKLNQNPICNLKKWEDQGSQNRQGVINDYDCPEPGLLGTHVTIQLREPLNTYLNLLVIAFRIHGYKAGFF